MNDNEFVLDCDSVSNFSSISGCTFTYDLLSVTSDYTSLEESEISLFQVELVEELLESDDLQNAFVANISGNQTILSEDEFTYETIVTEDDVDLVSATDDDDDSMPFEVASETEREDDCENDNRNDNVGSLNVFSNNSKKSSLDQRENGSAEQSNLVAIGAEEPSTEPKVNGLLENNGRLQRAKARRAEALKRYNDVLNNGSAGSFAATSLPTRSESTKRQESLKNLVSAIEAMGDAEILASTAGATSRTTQPTKKASLVSRTSTSAAAKRRSLIELRARRQESLRGLINAFDALLRDTTKVQTTTSQYSNKKLRSAAPASQRPIFTCV